MRSRVALGVAAVALLGVAGVFAADELKSGIPVGKGVPAFDVVKCGGAPDDGVKEGAKLCYR
jgi:hypothetical protein